MDALICAIDLLPRTCVLGFLSFYQHQHRFCKPWLINLRHQPSQNCGLLVLMEFQRCAGQAMPLAWNLHRHPLLKQLARMHCHNPQPELSKGSHPQSASDECVLFGERSLGHVHLAGSRGTLQTDHQSTGAKVR